MTALRAVDAFAGMGGLGLAGQRAGLDIVYANEFDKYPADLHDANFVRKVDRRSIVEVPADEVPPHDVMLGGFPCQAFSITGRRGGFEDERGKMFPEMLRIAAHHHTPLIVMENVKGLVSHDKGRTLETILRWLREAGYSAAWQVMSSWAHAGIPQARERVFIVASLTNPVGQSIFPMPLSGLPNPAETNTWRAFLDPAEEIPERYWYTPESQMGRLFAETLAREDRVYRFMGRTGVWGLHDNDKGLVPTLVASDGGGKVPSILDRVYKHHRADELRVHEMAPTMLANMGTGGGKVPMVLEQGEGVLRPRKLTERECARLQGFPDDYKMDVVSSTRQYRALGNSVTVPLAERVIRNALTLLD